MPSNPLILLKGCALSKGPSPLREPECSICYKTMKPDAPTIIHFGGYKCGNCWCVNCFNKSAIAKIQRNEDITCPLCRSPLQQIGTGFYGIPIPANFTLGQTNSTNFVVMDCDEVLQTKNSLAIQSGNMDFFRIQRILQATDGLTADLRDMNVDCEKFSRELITLSAVYHFSDDSIDHLWTAGQVLGVYRWTKLALPGLNNTYWFLPSLDLRFLSSYNELFSEYNTREREAQETRMVVLPIWASTTLVRRMIKASLVRKAIITNTGFGPFLDYDEAHLDIFDQIVAVNNIARWSIIKTRRYQTERFGGPYHLRKT
jgi:hypothetical protein